MIRPLLLVAGGLLVLLVQLVASQTTAQQGADGPRGPGSQRAAASAEGTGAGPSGVKPASGSQASGRSDGQPTSGTAPKSGSGAQKSSSGADKSSSGAGKSSSGAGKSGPQAKDGRRPLAGITPEREAAVMTFVQRNHEELAGLLESLKASSPRDYKRAVLDLHRTSERLAHIQERQPDRYDLELDLWKCESRLQLLVARLSMSDREELRAQLRANLQQQLDIRKKILLLERERAAQRVARLDEQIENIERDRERYVTQQVDRLTRPADEPRKAREEPVGVRGPQVRGGSKPARPGSPPER